MTPSHTRWYALLPAVVLCLGLVVYVELRLNRAVNRMREAVETNNEVVRSLERAVQLFRIEQSSAGQGIAALIEKITEFAPHLQQRTAFTLDYEKRMTQILDAVEVVGPEGFAELLAAYRNSEPGEGDELRRWLLPAMIRADRDRAQSFLVSLVRGLDPNYLSLRVTARNRNNAARELVELDQKLAGDVLASIFSYETARGVDPNRVPIELRNRVPKDGIGAGFDTLLNWYLRTEHVDTETIMLRILKSNEHRLLSKQTAVETLGDLRSRAAANAIERAYRNEPEGRTNPLFLNHCLDALGKILRSEACEFFREQSLEVDHDLVLTKLNSLLAEHCGSGR